MRTIRQLFSASCVAGALVLAVPFFSAPLAAQARPADATAQCKDGTYSKAKTKKGACSSHGGVTTWFADEKAAPASAAGKAAPASSAPAAAAPAAPASAKTTASTKTAATTAAAAPTKTTGKAGIVTPPAGTPENATAKCKDNTYSFAKQHSGACSRHGGVAEWYK